jgi:hypothetical protein
MCELVDHPVLYLLRYNIHIEIEVWKENFKEKLLMTAYKLLMEQVKASFEENRVVVVVVKNRPSRAPDEAVPF